MNSYPRGSEWRKWDLHIHTPESFHWNEGKRFPDMEAEEKETKIKEILKKINDSDVAVFTVVDYWTFEGYIALREYIANAPGSLSEGKLILPGIELRVEAPVDYRLNMQLMFDDALTTQCLRDFRQKLEIGSIRRSISDEALIQFARSLGADKAGLHGKQDYMENDRTALLLGSMTAEVTRESLEEAISSLPSRDRCLVVMPYDTSDGLADLDWRAHPQADNYFLQFADVFESRDQKTKDLFNGIKTEDNKGFFDNFYKSIGGAPHPVICGSDAHKVSDYGLFPSDKCTWVKADPSFEGLKQICFEPEARVRIQSTSPQLDFKKPYFNHLKIEGSVMGDGLPEFETMEIPLNSGMVTLIGGRGAGKSLLLDCFYKLFNKHKVEITDARLNKIDPNEFDVVYEKYDAEQIEYKFGEEADLDYLHVKQGDIKRVADSAEGLSREIKELLKISDLDEKPEYDFEISTIISRIEKELAWFELTDPEGMPINDKVRNEKVIEKNKNLVATITTGENKDSIEQFQKNNQEINIRRTITKKLSELKTKLVTIKVEINREIEEVNIAKIDGIKITPIIFDSSDSEIKESDETLQKSISEFTAANENIEVQFKALGIDQDVGGLLEKLSQYQKEIDLAEEKMIDYESKKLSIESDIQERTNLVTQIQEDLEVKKENIDTAFSQIKEGKSTWSPDQKSLVEALLNDISIKGKISFDLSRFYKGLGELLNGKKFRSTNGESQEEKIKVKFNVNTYDDYLRLIRNERIIDNGDEGYMSLNEFAVQKDYFLKTNFNIYEYLYLFSYRKNYLAVNPIIEYQGKSPDKLSVGQRGTFFVCMKLATDPFGSPFIFDQPEDDLDNKFIMRELVPLFRGIKKYRQVIIATHNANLVVNADAEQVIVASNDGERLSYFSGSLEHTSSIEPLGIRENVCDILEGGQTAFESREKKYGFGR